MIKTDIYKGSNGRVSKVLFTVNRSTQYGSLIFQHEDYIMYDYETGKWFGDEINADGWVELPEDEITYIVKTHELDDKLTNLLH